jgi:hypothetical protein
MAPVAPDDLTAWPVPNDPAPATTP